jgi:Zn finger protein HypA/HybF involved in hydrogenase expression
MENKNINKTLRFCKKCNRDLPKTLEYFPHRNIDKSRFGIYCKECINREKREKRSEKRKLWDKGGSIEGGNGRRCTICKITYPESLEYFGEHKINPSGLDTYCKICRRERGRLNYSKNKEKWNKTHNKTSLIKKNKIIDYKNNSCGCVKCSEKRHYLLDFHHIDPATKLFQIAQGESKGWEKVLEEINKCILLCSNCHREFHHLEKQNNINLQQYLDHQN